jgi:predicted TPR repeat methyltransferase
MTLPTELDAAIGRALARQAQGDLDGAAGGLRDVLRQAPEHPAALHFLGLVSHQQGDVSGATALLERAVRAAPDYVDAWNNLGAMIGPTDPARAIACFRRALELAPDAISTRGNLAVLLEEQGKLGEAVTELREIARLAPTEPGPLGHLASLLRRTGDHAGSVVIGKQLYALRPSEKLKDAVNRSYFLWFDQVDRDVDQAKRVLDEWLAFDSTDPFAAHMHAALSKDGVPDRASDGYVERHFDEFSSTFEKTLRHLGYCGPELTVEALGAAIPVPGGDLDVIDLGCGTGLVGGLIRGWARRIVGVDLSQRMLELAKQTGKYDELVHAELSTALRARRAAFDLATAADTLVYFGALETVFADVAGALRPGGRFIATVESLDDESPTATFVLHDGGRYAHATRYVTRALEGAGFEVERVHLANLRIEYGKPVPSRVFTARLRSAP